MQSALSMERTGMVLRISELLDERAPSFTLPPFERPQKTLVVAVSADDPGINN
jgi:hypothetical protein